MEPTQTSIQQKNATKPVLVMIIIVVLAIIFAIYLYGKHKGGIPFINPRTSSKTLTPEDAQYIMTELSTQNSDSQSVTTEDQSKIMDSFSQQNPKSKTLTPEEAENIFNTLNN